MFETMTTDGQPESEAMSGSPDSKPFWFWPPLQGTWLRAVALKHASSKLPLQQRGGGLSVGKKTCLLHWLAEEEVRRPRPQPALGHHICKSYKKRKKNDTRQRCALKPL